MKLIVAILLLPILALGQGVQRVSISSFNINHYLNTYGNAEGNTGFSQEAFQKFIQKLETKQESFKTDQLFLNHIFTKTHQHFLKHYTEYASFGELVKSGTYNCLTGTALYALLLEHFGFRYQVIETNYHIFLIAETTGGQVLIESTDPIKGFINDIREITIRIASYKQNVPLQASADKIYYRYNFELYNAIDLDQLLGLLHYNLAIKAYNDQQLSSAIAHLDEAMMLYQSPRIEEFSKIVLLSVAESKLAASVKETYLKKIQSIRKYKMPAVASSKSN